MMLIASYYQIFLLDLDVFSVIALYKNIFPYHVFNGAKIRQNIISAANLGDPLHIIVTMVVNKII